LKYEDVHILVHDANTRSSAEQSLEAKGGLDAQVIGGADTEQGFTITWHDIPNDSAWMRDNGPRYVVQDGQLRIQNWAFDAWGGAFGPGVTFEDDNAVPDAVGAYLGLAVDDVDIVHERGDLEFNGRDAVIINWTVIGDPNRNPGITKEQVDLAMQEWFGVSRVVLLEGAPTGDLTGGHIDGIARFIDHERVVVADCSAGSACSDGDDDDQIYDFAAEQLWDAGFEVVRWPFSASVQYKGQTFDTDYMNWLVGNGFVITVGFDHPEADAAAKAQLEAWFVGRDVYVIEMLESWNAGGGVHCHTNDQPSWPQGY
jgi:agmatine deiminase